MIPAQRTSRFYPNVRFCQTPRGRWYWCHLRDLVIPAKAGIYSANLWKCAVVRLDSRFRGNDRQLEWIPIPNDTSTRAVINQISWLEKPEFPSRASRHNFSTCLHISCSAILEGGWHGRRRGASAAWSRGVSEEKAQACKRTLSKAVRKLERREHSILAGADEARRSGCTRRAQAGGAFRFAAGRLHGLADGA